MDKQCRSALSKYKCDQVCRLLGSSQSCSHPLQREEKYHTILSTFKNIVIFFYISKEFASTASQPQYQEPQVPMAIITKLILLVAAASQALACVHATGYIQHDPIPGGANEGKFAQLWDNGDLKCQGIRGVDQDGHFTTYCQPGYAYAFTQDGRHAWYGYGTASFNWDQNPQKGKFDCDACNGKTGKCMQCTTIQWDNHLYGC
jgi:hypothetical protein